MLRDYQRKTADQVRVYEAVHPACRVLVDAPTGSGKTHIELDLLQDLFPQLLLTPRVMLFDQLSGKLNQAGIEHGRIASGKARDLGKPIQIAMLPTLNIQAFRQNSIPHVKGCRRVLFDEWHLMKRDVATRVIDHYRKQGASIVGFTASPVELGQHVDHHITAITVPELIDRGYLVPPVVIAPDVPDLEKVANIKRNANGEFDKLSIARIWGVRTIFGRVLEHWQRLNTENRPTWLFGPGVKESLWFAEQFTFAGYPAAHIDGKNVWVDGQFYKSDSAARQDVLDRLKFGDLAVVCSRFVGREGIDLPCIGHIIVATVFGTRSGWVQSCGRGLRPDPDSGKTRCIIQDHGGNYILHPALDSAEPWNITTPESQQSRNRVDRFRLPDSDPNRLAEPIVCPECFCARAFGDTCPNCGYASRMPSRWVWQTDGTLKQQTGRAIPERYQRVVKQSDDAETWKRLFWSARRHKPKRSLLQVYTFHARQNGWRYLPKDLPLMPKPEKQDQWRAKAGEVELADLR